MLVRLPHASLCLCCAAFALLPAAAQAGTKLTMKFQPGETFGYLISQEMTLDGEVQGNAVTTQMDQSLSISTHIKKVEEDGSAQVEQMIDRVQMKMVLPAPISQTIEYDTAKKDAPENPITMQMANSIGKMIGEAITLTISPQGEMSDVVIPEKLKQAQAGSGLGGNQIEQMFKQSGLHLPAEEISIGHTWDQTIEVSLPYGTMQTKTTYTYQGEDDNGLHKIDATMDVTLKSDEKAPVKVTAEAEEASGQFLFDNKAGRLASSEVRQVLNLEIGGIAKQTISTMVTTKLTEGKRAESKSAAE